MDRDMPRSLPATRPLRLRRFAVPLVFVIVLALGLIVSGTAGAAWREIREFLSLVGDPEPASANVLSEHEIEVLDQMPPVAQAECDNPKLWSTEVKSWVVKLQQRRRIESLPAFSSLFK